jgi:putative acetyltransferase
MRDDSPPGLSFALDTSALTAPDITLWTAWEGDEVLGMGALKALEPGWGEVKSMRTHPEHLRKGVGAAILDHIITEARSRGIRRLSLETGEGPAFEAALTLYRRRGFVRGERFADYPESDFNHYYHLDLG